MEIENPPILFAHSHYVEFPFAIQGELPQSQLSDKWFFGPLVSYNKTFHFDS